MFSSERAPAHDGAVFVGCFGDFRRIGGFGAWTRHSRWHLWRRHCLGPLRNRGKYHRTLCFRRGYSSRAVRGHGHSGIRNKISKSCVNGHMSSLARFCTGAARAQSPSPLLSTCPADSRRATETVPVGA